MGAALTYAQTLCLVHSGRHSRRRRSRRAGPWRRREGATPPTMAAPAISRRSRAIATAPGGGEERPPATSASRRREKAVRPARTVLGPEPSAALREQLLADIANLQSADEAADWVHKNLAAKNTLIDADADAVEAGFREKLATIELASAAGQEEPQFASAERRRFSGRGAFPHSRWTPPLAPIILPSSPGLRRRRVATKTIRLRDKEHCKFVATQPCIVCGRTPSEAHHIRFAQPRALGRKVSDEYTVPVCRLHHRELHGYGDEASWWAASQHRPSAHRARTVAEIAPYAASRGILSLTFVPMLAARRDMSTAHTRARAA